MQQTGHDGWVSDPFNRGLDCGLALYRRQVVILPLDGFSLNQAGRLAEVFNVVTHPDSSRRDPEAGYNDSFASTNGGSSIVLRLASMDRGSRNAASQATGRALRIRRYRPERN